MIERSTLKRVSQRGVLFLSLIAFLLTTLSEDAEARRRRRRRAHRRRAPIINEKKLYERIGGPKRLNEIVDEWMRLNLADGRIATAFTGFASAPPKLAKERKNLTDQLCEIADGPCAVKNEDKNSQGLVLNPSQFLIFGDNLYRSMQKYEIPEREKNEMLGRLNELKTDFAPDSPADEKS